MIKIKMVTKIRIKRTKRVRKKRRKKVKRNHVNYFNLQNSIMIYLTILAMDPSFDFYKIKTIFGQRGIFPSFSFNDFADSGE